MSLDFKIIKNYSGALYAASIKNKNAQEVLEQVNIVNKLLRESEKLREFFCSKIVNEKAKNKVVDLIVTRCNFSKTVKNFLHILAKNSRFLLLSEIAKDLDYVLMENNNIKYAQISSSKKLGNKELVIIKDFLEKELNKEIKLITEIDKSLLGGVVIRYDCNLIDCSISGALKEIKKVAVEL